MADRVSAFNYSVQFTPVENVCLFEDYNTYKDILIWKFCRECSNKKKCLIWKKIATTVKRPTALETYRKDTNTWLFKRKYPKMGGGTQGKLKDITEMVMNS